MQAALFVTVVLVGVVVILVVVVPRKIGVEMFAQPVEDLLNAAEKILPKRAWDWNQALMDFGSLICLTGRPKCEICPIQTYCKAYPGILKRNGRRVMRKQTVPFHETDRYFRGRIMDLLREREYMSVSQTRERFPEISDTRFETILKNLVKDGLLVRRGERILLP